MKVITGTAKGIPLKTLDGNDVRPTSQKVKEAVFSSIQFEIEGRSVLDLFAGSGQLGIEALSRGAKKATFVDASNQSISIVKENLNKTRLMEKAVVLRCDFNTFLKTTTDTFDIVFIDPPYYEKLYDTALFGVANLLSDNGLIICEHPDTITFEENIGRLSLQKIYKSGKIRFSIYRNSPEITK